MSTTMNEFVEDRRGAIMVIAIFMSAFLVGAIWYLLGVGEAIVYREQLRAAADATAFDAATVHALGMNMISMLNIVMAAVMAILILLTLIFFIAVAVTILITACAFIPFLGVACAGGISPMVQLDLRILQITNKFRDKFAFPAIKALNITEGSLAIGMPWVAKVLAGTVVDSYSKGVVETDMFSMSMIPMRVPFVSSKAFGAIDKQLQKLPILKDFPKANDKNPVQLRIPDFQRYGLPVEDDRFNMLCTHGGMVLVNGFGSLVSTIVGADPASSSMSDGFDKFGSFFGMIVGQMPGIFCSGLSPMDMLGGILGNIPLVGWVAKPMLDLAIKNNPALSKLEAKDGQAEDMLAPMKPFEMSKNGNGWMQIWSSVKGNPAGTKSANTGVLVPSWGLAQAPSEAVPGDEVDFAEAEFYYDCGAPDNGANQTILGYGDTSGDWGSCKYNAMWNLRWKARLRRYHEFEYDVLKSVELFLWSSLGGDQYLQALGNKIMGAGKGSFFKTQIIDRVKACFTSMGSGSSNCPIPLPTGAGKVGIGVGAGADYDLQKEVFH